MIRCKCGIEIGAPSGQLIGFSKHKGSSCKTALEHRWSRMVPNSFRTNHISQQKSPGHFKLQRYHSQYSISVSA